MIRAMSTAEASHDIRSGPVMIPPFDERQIGGSFDAYRIFDSESATRCIGFRASRANEVDEGLFVYSRVDGAVRPARSRSRQSVEPAWRPPSNSGQMGSSRLPVFPRRRSQSRLKGFATAGDPCTTGARPRRNTDRPNGARTKTSVSHGVRTSGDNPPCLRNRPMACQRDRETRESRL